MEEFIVNLAQGALDNLNYGWIVVLMAVESSFIPFPSEVVMIPAAYMVAERGEMSYWGVVLAGTVGAIIGALVNYVLAYYLGRPLVYAFANSRLGHMLLIDAEQVEKAERYFDDHGAISTLIGRLIPAIRQLISIPAGLARMHLGSFIGFTALGAAVWNVVLVLIGYFCHTIIDKDTLITKMGHYSHIIGAAAIALVVFIIIFLIWKGARGGRKTPASQERVAE
jgi:membrane protein DedA with SNARE-associated domain